MKKLSITTSYLLVICHCITIHSMQPGFVHSQDDLDQQLKTACLDVANILPVENLLKQGADPLAKDQNGNNCFHLLMQAAGNGEQRNVDAYIPMVKKLIKYDEQINYHDTLTNFLIKIDLENIFPKVLVNLIAKFTNRSLKIQKNNKGQTPLHIIFASKIPSTSLATLLIESGFICINVKDTSGRLPEHSPRPSLSPAQIKHYEKTKQEIIEIIKEARNIN